MRNKIPYKKVFLLTLFILSQFETTQVHAARDNAIGFGVNAELISAPDVQENSLNVFFKYGMNFTHFEIGPTLKLSFYDYGFGANTDYLGGLYFDYNLVENTSSKDFIYGPTVEIGMGNKNYGSDGRAQITQMKTGGFLTWFLSRSSLAVKAEFGYAQRIINRVGLATTTKGVMSQIYFDYYF